MKSLIAFGRQRGVPPHNSSESPVGRPTTEQEGRDVLRPSQTHPQAGSVATSRALRCTRRVLAGRYRSKPEENGQIDTGHRVDTIHIRTSNSSDLASIIALPTCILSTRRVL